MMYCDFVLDQVLSALNKVIYNKPISRADDRSRERDSLEDETTLTLSNKRGTKRKLKRETEEDISVLESMDNVEKTEDSKYRCKLCHYSHLDSFMIRQHMRLHKEKKPFECSLCEFVAVSSEDLQDHMIDLTEKLVINKEAMGNKKKTQKKRKTVFVPVKQHIKLLTIFDWSTHK